MEGGEEEWGNWGAVRLGVLPTWPSTPIPPGGGGGDGQKKWKYYLPSYVAGKRKTELYFKLSKGSPFAFLTHFTTVMHLSVWQVCLPDCPFYLFIRVHEYCANHMEICNKASLNTSVIAIRSLLIHPGNDTLLQCLQIAVLRGCFNYDK